MPVSWADASDADDDGPGRGLGDVPAPLPAANPWGKTEVVKPPPTGLVFEDFDVSSAALNAGTTDQAGARRLFRPGYDAPSAAAPCQKCPMLCRSSLLTCHSSPPGGFDSGDRDGRGGDYEDRRGCGGGGFEDRLGGG
eukprot:3348018-Rhodomonas_salina.1